jgi:GTP-binding protein Era
MLMENYKSGFIAIVGLPNAGKSTLLNHILGKQLAIVSNKPQTTRNRILGIRTTEESQMLFMDTPGWYKGEMKIDKFFRSEVQSSLSDADMVIYVVDCTKPNPRQNRDFYNLVRTSTRKPVLLIANKIDRMKQAKMIPVISSLSEYYGDAEEIIPLSAKTGDNASELVPLIEKYLPDGPRFYPGETYTDRSVPFLLSEFVRESLIQFLEQELPFSIAVVVEDFIEEETKLLARISIYVERDGQKRIVVGTDGSNIKKAKGFSEMRGRRFFGKKVFLELRVKVKANWRQNDNILGRIGYKQV